MNITVTDGDYMHKVANGKAEYDVKGELTIRSKERLWCVASEDVRMVSGESVFIMAEKEIRLQVGKSILVMNKDGTIEINGINISLKARDIAINGSSSVNISGKSITSAAINDHNISGAIVVSDGTASNTVQGGMVLLNP